MTIKNFRQSFEYWIINRGVKYFLEDRVTEFHRLPGNRCTANVRGSKNNSYHVLFDLDNKGNITNTRCNCAYSCGGLFECKHLFAVLMYVESIYDTEISSGSSPEVSRLISTYTRNAVEDMTFSATQEMAHIVPELVLGGKSLKLKLRIGKEKNYIVNDINQLYYAFQNNSTRRYGKNFEFTHDYRLIDDKSKNLLNLAFSIYRDFNSYSYSKKELDLKNHWLERFLQLYKDYPLIIGGKTYEIVRKNPSFCISLTRAKDGLSFSMDNPFLYLGQAEMSYFLSQEKQTLFCADKDFSRTFVPLLEKSPSHIQLFIAKDDIPSFYNAVIKQLEKYAKINSDDLPEDILPPQMNANFYVDVNENDDICAHLEFVYGDKTYSSFYDKKTNPFCDKPNELFAVKMVETYFDIDTDNERNPYIIRNDTKIFDFVTSGLSDLSKYMEVFVSERFQRINIRKPAQPNVGVKTSNGLLELDISADGYSAEELLELLKSYRRGSKYHRFKDGSFSIINDSLDELGELTKELNITDKTFLKQHIKVPMYRMLYLNSLQENLEHIRIRRSKDFKRLIEDFNSSLKLDDEDTLPVSLSQVMRGYQKTGFDWLNTLSMYHLGGILADDMGLGKTIQAIALMLSVKEHSKEHKQFFVVCPSSLTINWANEIERFAPDLKTVCLNGTVAERSRLFEELSEYDVVISSYATVLRDIDKYEDLHFAIQFIDEAQNIKNHNTQSSKAVKTIKSELRFALTGTPIENSLAELWSIFDFIMPGYLYHYNYFKKNYETPIVKQQDQKAIASLQKLTSPFILRRLKKEVLTELPDKTETIVYSEMESEQKKLYIANAVQIKGELEGLGDNQDKIKILAMLTRLRQLCCDPALVYENYTDSSVKLEQCIELVKSCIEAGHKILLFSQFTTMLERISKRFDAEGITYFTLTGKTKSRDRLKLVNEFNENDVNVFLISLKAGGTGLNLTGADIVIHYDPWWNVSAENQASDRAHRIGQKNNVQIYKLIVKDTIEEKIRILQQKKSDLLEMAVNGDGNIMNMTADEVISLLE